MMQQRFGSSSEKLSADQINLFNEALLLSGDDAPYEEKNTNVPAHRRKKIRASIPEELPRTEVIHDLSEAERFAHMMELHYVILAMKLRNNLITSQRK
jgi:transposase